MGTQWHLRMNRVGHVPFRVPGSAAAALARAYGGLLAGLAPAGEGSVPGSPGPGRAVNDKLEYAPPKTGGLLSSRRRAMCVHGSLQTPQFNPQPWFGTLNLNLNAARTH